MTGTRKIFLDETYFSSLDTAPTNVNVIICNPLLYNFVHNGTIQNKETISLQGVVKTEYTYAGRDSSAGNIGGYCFNGTDNTLCLLVDPTIVTTNALAQNYLKGILIEYSMIDLTYSSSESLYVMESYLSDGTKIGSTLPSSFDTLTAKMNALDQYQNPNLNGYYIHVLNRSLQAS